MKKHIKVKNWLCAGRSTGARTVIAALLLLTMAGAASATTYYVRTDGNDANTGTANDAVNAWLTVQKCASTITAGDICRIQAGTYNEQNITFANEGSIGSEIQIVGDGLPTINGTNTIFNITKTNISISGLILNSTTTKVIGTQNSTIYPVIKIIANNINISDNNISYYGFGGYLSNQPENAGYQASSYYRISINTPGIYILGSSNNLIWNNSIYVQNINSEGIYLETSTNNNISNNSIKSLHYYSIMFKPYDSQTNFNHIINNNTGLQGYPIYYYYNVNNVVVPMGNSDQIIAAYLSNITVADINITNGDGIMLIQVTNSNLRNYTNTRVKSTGSGTGGIYDAVKTTLDCPLYAYVVTGTTFSNISMSIGGRVTTGMRVLEAFRDNVITNFSVTSSDMMDGVDGHNGILYERGDPGGDRGSNNTWSYLDYNSSTFSDNTIELSGTIYDSYFNNGYIYSSADESGAYITGVTGGSVNFTNFSFIGVGINAIAVKLSSGTAKTIFTDGVFNNSKSGSSDIESVGNTYLINSTMVNNRLILTSGTLYNQYYLDVHVQNSTSPLSSANVNISQNNGTYVSNQSTNVTGDIIRVLLTQYIVNTSGRFYSDYVNYTLETSSTGYTTDSRNFNISANRVETITIVQQGNDNYIPPTPANLANTTGNFWVNHTWSAGAGNTTDRYNISFNNGTWLNGSISNFSNNSVGASNWSNISVWAFNSSGSGALSLAAISTNTQAPAAPTPTPTATATLSRITLTAKTAGTAGNTIATTETLANASFGDITLTGGLTDTFYNSQQDSIDTVETGFNFTDTLIIAIIVGVLIWLFNPVFDLLMRG